MTMPSRYPSPKHTDDPGCDCLLITEDERIVRRALQILEPGGYRVTVIHEGRKGLEALESHWYPVCLVDQDLIDIARNYFGHDQRVTITCTEGKAWIDTYTGPHFDLIFADAWSGKYFDLEETLALLKRGGFYVIDDMTPQPNWPEAHQSKADALIAYLEERRDLTVTKMNWSTGVVVCTKA